MNAIPTNYTFDDDFSITVQKKFLSVLIFDQKWAAINGLDIIKPEYFESRLLFNVCTWIHDYYKQYKSIPTKLVLTEKAKDFTNDKGLTTKEYYQYTECIDEIFTINDHDDFEYFKEKAVIFIRQVAWKHALAKGGDTLKAGNYEEAMNAFKKVLSLGAENDLGLDMEDLPTETFLDLLKESYDKSNMIKTGIPGWDKALGGGFVKNNVHIIAGAPGQGKSRTMAFLTSQALQDFKKVIFITLELTEAETMANIYTSATGVGIHDMLNPAGLEDFKKKLANFKNTYCSDLVVKFYKPSTITTDTIHNYIQKVIQKKQEAFGKQWKPDIIFIDYLDKLLPTQKVKGNIYEDNGNTATDCKNLGVTFECPVVSGSQLGRYVWSIKGNSVISMDSIAESAAKVHIAHSMTTLNSNPQEKEQMKTRLFIAKSRSGCPGKVIYCENNLGRCLMYETDPWDPETLISTNKYTIKSANEKN